MRPGAQQTLGRSSLSAKSRARLSPFPSPVTCWMGLELHHAIVVVHCSYRTRYFDIIEI